MKFIKFIKIWAQKRPLVRLILGQWWKDLTSLPFEYDWTNSPVSEWCDNQTIGVAEILKAVFEARVNHHQSHCLVLPIVPGNHQVFLGSSIVLTSFGLSMKTLQSCWPPLSLTSPPRPSRVHPPLWANGEYHHYHYYEYYFQLLTDREKRAKCIASSWRQTIANQLNHCLWFIVTLVTLKAEPLPVVNSFYDLHLVGGCDPLGCHLSHHPDNRETGYSNVLKYHQ